MGDDCLICHESMTNKTVEDDPLVIVYQTCECVYNVHKYCLVKWSKHHSKCIICHKRIHVHRKNRNISPGRIQLCCVIL